MSTLSVIDLKWCHLGASPAHFFCCLVCGASAELNPLSHSGWKGGSCFCVHSPLTPALPQRQPWTVSETCLCTKGPHCSIRGSFVLKEATNPTSDFLFPLIFICITRILQVTVGQFFLVDLDPTVFHCTELGSFVCVYVIAWQGSAPSRLCEGLNVIHWAETVLLPASLSPSVSAL